MKVLIVKTTSMGDVVHASSVVSDIRKNFPRSEIDWLVEDSFADIPRAIAGVNEVIECSVRKWRKNLFSKTVRSEISALRKRLSAKHYDCVIDLQGLIKSALLAVSAGVPVSGYDASSIKEPVASLFYKKKYSVGKTLSAVQRCRALTALSLGYEVPQDAPAFDFALNVKASLKETEGDEVIFFCNTSRETKLWPEQRWIELGRQLISEGEKILFVWGLPSEKERVTRLANALGAGASVLEKMSIGALMKKTALCKAAVGVDTGMTHLASVLGVPTVGIFCDYPVELVPLEGGGKKKALGGVGCSPSVEEVRRAFQEVLA